MPGFVVTGGSSSNSLIGLGYNFGGFEVLLGMRSVYTTIQFDQTFTYELFGTSYTGVSSGTTTSSWNTTGVGLLSNPIIYRTGRNFPNSKLL